MKIARSVPGDIVECGVFKGTSLVRFALIRKLLGDSSSRILAFDTFSKTYPNTKYKRIKYKIILDKYSWIYIN